ncbi:MAG: hypothetical protein IAI50_16515 [Candidatus Eremiobacteraeota bacterium]|nr:hypothetical protein [Candidatus Eremiobacteraeota bacterium]
MSDRPSPPELRAAGHAVTGSARAEDAASNVPFPLYPESVAVVNLSGTTSNALRAERRPRIER